MTDLPRHDLSTASGRLPLDVFEAAKKACARAGWRLSNLQLQKILYLAQLNYKRRYPGQRLIDASFEAWDFGPVISSVYHRVKGFGANPVGNVFHLIPAPERDLDSYLNGTVDAMASKTPGQLVAMTHREGGAWANYYRPGIPGITIPDAAIDVEAAAFKAE